MPPGEELNINPDLFIPQVGKNYIAPYLISKATGTTYESHTFHRPVILQALTPETVGTIYAYPGNQPTGDDATIQSVNGTIFLDGRGIWYFRHGGVGTEVFRVLDAGGAGNAGAMDAANTAPRRVNLWKVGGTLQTGIDLAGKYSPLTMSTQSVNADIDAASETLIATNTARRFLYIRNTSSAGQILYYKFVGTAVDGEGFALAAGEEHSWGPLTMPPPTGAVNIIASAANGSAAFAEGS